MLCFPGGFPQKSFLVIIFLIVILAPLRIAQAQEPDLVAIQIKHQPITAIPARKIAEISVAVKDEVPVEEVRLYLKTYAKSWYVYMIMEKGGKNTFTTIFPPAKNDTRGIDYLFVIQNSRGQIFKTKPYRVLVQNDYRSPPVEEKITLKVYSEVSSPPPHLNDFIFPFTIEPSNTPLLSKAEQYQYPLVRVPGPAGRGGGPGNFLDGLGDITATITLGGVGIQYSSR